eukprot:SAG31_NODE_45456_length_258_cov_1.962264_1_plen_28_part_01
MVAAQLFKYDCSTPRPRPVSLAIHFYLS